MVMNLNSFPFSFWPRGYQVWGLWADPDFPPQCFVFQVDSASCIQSGHADLKKGLNVSMLVVVGVP